MDTRGRLCWNEAPTLLKTIFKGIVGFTLFIFPSVQQVYGQSTSNLRCKWVGTDQSIFLDTLTIPSNTIAMDGSYDYDFNTTTSELTFLSTRDLPDSVHVCYRTFPFNLSNPVQRYSLQSYDSTVFFKGRSNAKVLRSQRREELFPTENIYKSGTLTRGISFGNAQSVGVQSSLNFQMEGKLTDDLNIKAVITDQNIPFQPEGNTQQLREFDNVFIEVYNEKLSLRAGDVVLKNPASNFLRYYKNVQGGQFKINYNINKAKVSSSATVSTAKGQFSDITIEPIEGVQGPYKLRGPSGERFVIVLANSEQVYLDGRLLKRGYDQDYIIDYNLGELVFNPNILITRFTRIRATFEYSDRNYSRSILSTTHEITKGKTSVFFNYYREKDDRNRPLAYDLSDQDKILLSEAGEDQLPVPISSDREVSFNQNLLLYEKKDTLDRDGQMQSVFVFSRDSMRTLFQVTFSEVGFGSGDYILLDNTVNGRVFQWVTPENGVSSGNYAAIVFVVAPNMRQMATMGFNTQLSDYDRVFGELALSNHDLNLFSNIGDQDNKDFAYKLGYRMKDRPVSVLGKYKWSMAVDFEHDGTHFRPIDRFRYIEYDRDWSYNPNNDTTVSTDNIFNFNTSLYQNERDKLSYRFASRQRGQVIDGVQHDLGIRKKMGSFQLITNAYLMRNARLNDESEWKKLHLETYFDQFPVVPGYKFDLDMNEISNSLNDSITGTAMHYAAHQFYLRSADSLNTTFRMDHTIRRDQQPLQGIMEDFTRSYTTNLNLQTKLSEHSDVNMVFTYRNLEFSPAFSTGRNEETILGRLDWNGRFLKRHLRSDLSYAASSSRELRREFVFLAVNNGEGTHTWRDLNQDGIQDITEFFEAINLDERNFIKLFVPTDEFIAAFNTILNWSLDARMPRVWAQETGFKNFLSRFSNLTNININKKNTNDDFESRFNPFDLATDDQDLIFVRTAIRNNLFYNRSKPGFGFDVEYFNSSSKQLITKGVETRTRNRLTLNTRFNISKEVTINWSLSEENKENASDFLENRNFRIQGRSATPQFIWQPNTRFRWTTQYQYIHKTNLLTSDVRESSKINRLEVLLRWTRTATNALDLSARYTNIAFNGDQNTPSAYELLEALRPGSNYSWNFSYRQRLSNGLQITVGYNGRKSPDQNIIHLGRMQVTALF